MDDNLTKIQKGVLEKYDFWSEQTNDAIAGAILTFLEVCVEMEQQGDEK